MEALPVLPAEASFSSSSALPTDASSQDASLSSTPPTTVADSISLASEPPKADNMSPPPAVAGAAEEGEEEEEKTIRVKAGPPTPLPETETETESGTITALTTTTTMATTTQTPTRPRRARASMPVYNLAQLAGTSKHAKRRGRPDAGAAASDKKRRTISGDTLVGGPDNESSEGAERAVRDGIDALDLQWSMRGLDSPRARRAKNKETITTTKAAPSSTPKRYGTRRAGEQVETLATKLSSLGKRGRKTFEKGLGRMTRELRRLQDTNEFAHIDDRPVRHTVWSNGKFVDPDEVKQEDADAAAAPARKKAKTDEAADKQEEEEEEQQQEQQQQRPNKKRAKKWLDRGLYSGQEAPLDISKGLTTAERKKLAQIPELVPSGRANKSLPTPMFNGLRMLINGRDFKLPYDVCNPLPPGQPKPDEWRKMTKNRFVGDAAAYWRKTPHFKDFQSKCVCKPEDGCDEDCQNKIMLYECDETNCNVGRARCSNRAFATLQDRTKAGGKYRVGVEVIKTADRGYGVRANRCFEPNQIIMEYTGEIITEEECDRRMNELYKNNACYYLMSFDQNMIIDATTGSIARFVNHSCAPNCRMIKWIVGGQPRMALFAGDRPIMTGEELTYDYKFDPFSAKNVQKCLCGSDNCRGVLGPKPKEEKKDKAEAKGARKDGRKEAKASVTSAVNAGKRKLKELLGGEADEADSNSAKKRKIKPLAGVKRSLSNTGAKAAKGVAKGATAVLKRGMATVSANSRSSLAASSGAKKTTKTMTTTTTTKTTRKVVRKAVSTGVLKKYGRSSLASPKQAKLSASRNDSNMMTIVAAGGGGVVEEDEEEEEEDEAPKFGASKRSRPAKGAQGRRSLGAAKSPRKGLELTRTAKIRVVQEGE